MSTREELDFERCYLALTARDARFDGRFYTAVTSTGIYCRPICPARTPARRNVRFYAHAAAAEAAGFRPCRRCRPELSPGSPGWDVRADLVGRALRLIDDGVADDLGVAGLARRLHVTERHLRRLFTTEVGTGPLAVARTRRLLLAKQLLTETPLPVTEVAFAAGFGSVRQFNAAMKESYGFAPGDLRKAVGPLRSAAGPSEPQGLTLRLGYREPYDAESLLRFLASRAIPGVESVAQDGDAVLSYSRVIPGGTLTLAPAAGHVRLTVQVDDMRRLARIVARCRRLLDLDADPDAIESVLGPTALGPLVAKRPGLRVPGAFDAFELVVRAVVGQQVSVAGARTLLGRICAGGAFPTAGELAERDLSGIGLTNRRITTLRAVATAVAGGDIDLDGGDPAETAAALLEIPGIGPWTVGYIALRALRDPDAWPGGDLVLRKTMARLAIPETEIERWRPWRAYAALHLWNA
ncbi:AlkA N-terminal domain-containing protein [Acrocarpospora catenulata]|uniref:AlkA N-terminal domain-containing protein n=1 Tax=Acrocarpospora catenulata TaxID=2836182 RepID=UPI001BDAC9E3|nr:AlkA N-terminal domain-containing protein [Acrocarpospora catenulata]